MLFKLGLSVKLTNIRFTILACNIREAEGAKEIVINDVSDPLFIVKLSADKPSPEWDHMKLTIFWQGISLN